ncbi:MAG: glycosyltransferase family 2 protein [candidate division KSB1 bacterium]|nr:glycosyltransferase family 2 protein [candidate division KSB1 bacterium]MDZ7296252.1 glycosyltransferase family 2 protein [candidate division KSB1 bacterium]MDZ7393557.1 glycosyltransferase family 2 protein [candidate division KSB1 bacterium]MDZ7411990.1 glycosyltransferase family 2 protein [candidate division KSB1 bacterium]
MATTKKAHASDTRAAAVSVVIPAFNEEGSVGSVVEAVRAALRDRNVEHEVIVVDDGSADRTAEVALAHGAHVIHHRRNRGYGAALKTGIRAARHETILITDADGTYPAASLPELLARLDRADMVVGARVKRNARIPLLRRPGKWLLGRLAEHITGEKIPDLNSGLRAFRRQCVQQYLPILPDRFSFTTTITVALLSDGYRVEYLPIDYYKRQGKSKIVPWNFFEFVALVLRLSMSFNPLRIFVPVSMVCFLLGLIKLAADVVFAVMRVGSIGLHLLSEPVVSTTAVVFLLFGLQILLIGMMSDGLARKIAQRIPTDYESRAVEELVEQRHHKEA